MGGREKVRRSSRGRRKEETESSLRGCHGEGLHAAEVRVGNLLVWCRLISDVCRDRQSRRKTAPGFKPISGGSTTFQRPTPEIASGPAQGSDFRSHN